MSVNILLLLGIFGSKSCKLLPQEDFIGHSCW